MPTQRTVIKRNPLARLVGDRLAPLFQPSMVRKLSVPGRRTGRWRTTPVVVLDHEDQRYLLTPFGRTEWTENLRAAGRGRLASRGQIEEFTATEVPEADRPPLIEAYVGQFGRFPGVARAFEQLPDPADHPTFRITTVTPPAPA